MARRIRRAQVEPPTPNNVAPECICVPKVYDWVVITEDITTTVPIPTPTQPNCPPSTVTGITCSLGTQPFFPVSCVGEGACTILERRPANIDGLNARIVKLRHEIPVSVTFTGTDATGAPASCTVSAIVPFIQQVILCFPDEFSEENLVCRVISGDCTITTPPPVNGQPFPTSIGIELLLCIEIQVLAAVKLEVLARFCSPRAAIPVTAPSVCPPLSFPQQCDFFPQPSCDCQSTVNNTCLIEGVTGATCTLILNGEAVDEGTQTLQATICNSCSGINTNINYSFTSTASPSDNFTFTANSFTSESCNDLLPIIHTITGTGTVVNSSGAVTVTYTLVLTETALGAPDSYTLTLSGPGFNAFASNTAVPDSDLLIVNCNQFPEPTP